MNKQCCKWHDGLPDFWQDDETENTPESNRLYGESPECGLAGMGIPAACCPGCPSIQHLKRRGVKIDYAIEIMALPMEKRP
jgi:hypothetical protein